MLQTRFFMLQYYYNAQSQQFLYWDGERQTYLPAPTSEQADATIDGDSTESKKDKEKEKKERVKTAKRIVKDMERWAKTLNQRKDNFRAG